MTREEAIEWIENIKKKYIHGGDEAFDDARRKAIDMAIEVLQAKIDGDLISRADAIEAIESRQTEQWIDADVDYNNGLDSAIAEIKALPSAESVQGEWIVTEHCSNEFGFRKWIEIECPFCGEKPVHEGLNNMNYCPNCGAKMKID